MSTYIMHCNICEGFTGHTDTTEGDRIKTYITTCNCCGYTKKVIQQFGVHYQDIRTESDFRKRANYYDDKSKIHVEIDKEERFFYIYTLGTFSTQLNLMVFDKDTLLSICKEQGIEQKEY